MLPGSLTRRRSGCLKWALAIRKKSATRSTPDQKSKSAKAIEPGPLKSSHRLISAAARSSVRPFIGGMRARDRRDKSAENGVADIFKEIDEELRQDRAAKLWKRYGNYVIAVAVVVVLGVAGFRFWQQQDQAAREGDSSAYQSALARAAGGDVDGAVAALGTLADDGSGGYAVLARLQQASLAAGSGDREGAMLAFDAVANDGSAPAVLRDLARLQSVAQRLDTAPASELTLLLGGLATAGSPWRSMALELKGLVALKSGDNPAARTVFAELADDAGTPERMRARAAELLKALPR